MQSKPRSIVYESKCLISNPTTSPEEEDLVDLHSGKPGTSREGIYVGESSRSLYEWAVEHVRDARTFSAKSHIVKHWMTAHPSLLTPPKVGFIVHRKLQGLDCA